MGDKVPKHRSPGGPYRRTPGPADDATTVIPVIRATDAIPIRAYRAAPVEWNWRVVFASAIFCCVSFCAAGAVGILGERDGLYIAAFGLGGFLTTLTFVTLDWAVQRKGERK